MMIDSRMMGLMIWLVNGVETEEQGQVDSTGKVMK
jgi:hypothetical protein